MIVVNAVLLDIIHSAVCGIDKPICVHKGKFFKGIKLPHSLLIRLQMCYIAEIVLCQKADCRLHIPDISLQCRRDYLFTPACKLVKIQLADRCHRSFSILLCFLPRPVCTEYEYRCYHKAAYHSRIQSCFILCPFHINSSLVKSIYRLHNASNCTFASAKRGE